jgi:hypothetical protein
MQYPLLPRSILGQFSSLTAHLLHADMPGAATIDADIVAAKQIFMAPNADRSDQSLCGSIGEKSDCIPA